MTSLPTPSSEAAAVIRATPCPRAAIAASAPVEVTEAIAGLLLDVDSRVFQRDFLAVREPPARERDRGAYGQGDRLGRRERAPVGCGEEHAR